MSRFKLNDVRNFGIGHATLVGLKLSTKVERKLTLTFCVWLLILQFQPIGKSHIYQKQSMRFRIIACQG